MNKKIFMNSIQHRLSLLLIFTTTFVLTGFALVGYSTGKSEIKTELNGLTDFWTEQLSKTLKQPLWTFNYSIIEEIVNSTMLEKHIYAIIVRNVQGNFSSGKMRDDNWNINCPDLSEKTEGFRISGLSQQHADFKRFPIELNQCRSCEKEGYFGRQRKSRHCRNFCFAEIYARKAPERNN